MLWQRAPSHGSGRVTRLTYPHSAEAWRSYEWWATQAWLSSIQTCFETGLLTCTSFWCIDSTEFWPGLWVLCIFQIGVQIACPIKLILTKWWKSTSLNDSMVFEVTVIWAQQRKGECHKHEYRRIWNTSQNSWHLYSMAKIMKLVWLWLDHKAVGKDIQNEYYLKKDCILWSMEHLTNRKSRNENYSLNLQITLCPVLFA